MRQNFVGACVQLGALVKFRVYLNPKSLTSQFLSSRVRSKNYGFCARALPPDILPCRCVPLRIETVADGPPEGGRKVTFLRVQVAVWGLGTLSSAPSGRTTTATTTNLLKQYS